MKKPLPIPMLLGVLGVVGFMIYTGIYIFVYMFRAFRATEPVTGEVVQVWHGDPFARAIFVSVLFLIGLVILVWVGLTRGEALRAGQSIKVRSDLWLWLVQHAEATNEDPERIAERAVSAYRARLEGVGGG
jgi:hypothetical protein